jgi:hypothetical protein
MQAEIAQAVSRFGARTATGSATKMPTTVATANSLRRTSWAEMPWESSPPRSSPSVSGSGASEVRRRAGIRELINENLRER